MTDILFLCVFAIVFLCILQRVWRGRLPRVCESGALTILVILSEIPSSSYYWFTAALRYYGGWIPGGEYRRCDNVIYHRCTPHFPPTLFDPQFFSPKILCTQICFQKIF